MGATHALDPSLGVLDEQVRAIVPDGVDYAFDTTGIPAVLEQAIGVIAPLGTLGFVGVPHDLAATVAVPIVPAMVTGLTLRGITEGDSDLTTFIPYLLEQYRAGEFPFDRIITTYSFDEIDRAVTDQLQGAVAKAVLVL